MCIKATGRGSVAAVCVEQRTGLRCWLGVGVTLSVHHEVVAGVEGGVLAVDGVPDGQWGVWQVKQRWWHCGRGGGSKACLCGNGGLGKTQGMAVVPSLQETRAIGRQGVRDRPAWLVGVHHGCCDARVCVRSLCGAPPDILPHCIARPWAGI